MLLEFAGDFDEFFDVRHNLRFREIARDDAAQAGIIQHAAQQMGNRDALRQLRPRRQQMMGVANHGRRKLRRNQIGVVGVEAQFLPQRPAIPLGLGVGGDVEQLVVRQAEQGRTQDARQRDVLPRIGQDAQQVRQIENLLLREKADAAGHEKRNAAPPQRLFKILEAGARAQ